MWLAHLLRRREVAERRAARDRVLHETAMAATVVLRGEERVSLRAVLYFSLFSTLVLRLLYSIIFDI